MESGQQRGAAILPAANCLLHSEIKPHPGQDIIITVFSVCLVRREQLGRLHGALGAEENEGTTTGDGLPKGFSTALELPL